MSDKTLLPLMLLVSVTSLVLQGAALIHLVHQKSRYQAERTVARGYVRTAACRVAAACIYVTAAVLQAAGVKIPGAGALTPEALVVLTVVQGIWLANAALDIRVRRKLRACASPRMRPFRQSTAPADNGLGAGLTGGVQSGPG